MGGPELAGHLNSLIRAGWGHADVGHDRIGPLLLDRGRQRLSIGGAGDDLDPVDAAQNLLQRLPDQVGVIGDHHPDGRTGWWTFSKGLRSSQADHSPQADF